MTAGKDESLGHPLQDTTRTRQLPVAEQGQGIGENRQNGDQEESPQ